MFFLYATMKLKILQTVYDFYGGSPYAYLF